MRFLLSLLLSVFLAAPAFAGVKREDNDIKLPSQAVMEFQKLTTPAAASNTAVLAATNNPSTSTALLVTTGITNPDFARNVTVTTGGTTGDCAAGNVVVTGTNYFGKTITESLAITNAQNGTTTGAKAFRTVTSISLPAEQSTHSCTFAVGIGTKFGMKRCMDVAGYLDWASVNGAYETTYPTVTADPTHVESNTVSTNTAPNGSKDIAFFFVQNFRCLP